MQSSQLENSITIHDLFTKDEITRKQLFVSSWNIALHMTYVDQGWARTKFGHCIWFSYIMTWIINPGEVMNFGNIGIEELRVTLKTFFILESYQPITQFCMMGTKPMFHIIQIRLHLHETRVRSWLSRSFANFGMNNYFWARGPHVETGNVLSHEWACQHRCEENPCSWFFPRDVPNG